MKKIVFVILVGLLLLSSCVPQSTTEPSSLPLTEETSVNTKPQTLPQTDEESVDPHTLLTPSQRERIQKHLPVMDGSTSLIPYEAGLRSALYGIDFATARQEVEHSSTWGSFRALLAGEVDMIFTCPMSDEQYQTVAQTAKELVEIPVAMEAFVFVVNAENPVDSLTQEQLRDIYAGKITNWKEVGGLDAPIIAYQRNADSGSQNFMIDFMGEVPLMEPPVTQIAYVMGSLMDKIAVNDNSLHSIGYSVYSYAADMYENSSLTKFIKVDGVAPTRLSMNDRSYPLLDYNYAVYEKNVASDSATALLARYLLSPEAQLAAAKAGYVPTTKIDYDFSQKPEHTLGYYDGVGCGGQAPERLPDRKYEIASQEGKAVVAALKNELLREEILSHWQEPMAVEIQNGYLMLSPQKESGRHPSGSGTRVLVWDLFTEKRLSLEELFFDGVAIDEVIGQMLTDGLEHRKEYEFGEREPVRVKREETWWGVTLDGAYLVSESPYGEVSCSVSDWSPVPLMVSQIPRSMEGLFDDNVNSYEEDLFYEFNEDYQAVPDGQYPMGCNYYKLREDIYPAAKKINEDFIKYIQEHFYYEKAYQEAAENLEEGEEHPWLFLGIPVWKNRQYGGAFCVYYDYHHYGRCKAESYLYYDLTTGERLASWKELYREGWEDALSPEDKKHLEQGDLWRDTITTEGFDVWLSEEEMGGRIRHITVPEAYRRY